MVARTGICGDCGCSHRLGVAEDCPVTFSPRAGDLPPPTCCPDAGGGAMIRLDDGRWCCVWCERIAAAGEPLRQLVPPDAPPAAIPGPPRPAPMRIPSAGRKILS